MSAIVRFYG